MKHLKSYKIFEKVILGEFVNNYEMMIIDIIDTGDEYIEYIAYGVNDKQFYLLDPDFEIINGPFLTIEDLMDENSLDYPEGMNLIKESKKDYTIEYINNNDISKYSKGGRQEFTKVEYEIINDLIENHLVNRFDYYSAGSIALRLNLNLFTEASYDLLELIKYNDEYYVLPYVLSKGVSKSIVIDGFDSFRKLEQILLDHKYMM